MRARVPTPNIDNSPLLRAIRDALWDRLREERRFKKRRITAWIEGKENAGGELWDDAVGPMLRQIEDWLASESCSRCGESADDGEGWNGLCGNCADRQEGEEKS